MPVYPQGNSMENLLNVCLDRKKSFYELLKWTNNHQLRSQLHLVLCENHLCYQNLQFAFLDEQVEQERKYLPNGGMVSASVPKQDVYSQHYLVHCLESEKKHLAIFKHSQKHSPSPIIELIAANQVKSIQRSILFLEKFLSDLKKSS